MPATPPTVLQLYMEGKGGDNLPWQLKAGIIALYHHDDASHRVMAGKLDLDETTVGKGVEEAKAQAQSDLFMDQLNTLDQQAKNGSHKFRPCFVTTYAYMITFRGRPVQFWSSSRRIMIYGANPRDK